MAGTRAAAAAAAGAAQYRAEYEGAVVGRRAAAAGIALGGLLLALNGGANVTTYVIPVEVFPAESRASLHGVSAGAGKVGAVAGAFLFPLVRRRFASGIGSECSV